MKKWLNWILWITLVCLLLVAIPLTYSGPKTTKQFMPMFDEYIKAFNKTYKDDPIEYEERLTHFVASVKEIEKLNAASTGSETSRARYGLTKLSDMSKEEYKNLHLSDEMPNKRTQQHDTKEAKPGYNTYNVVRKRRALLPLQVDWRSKGVVGPVRNQGLCGACWAFSTVGAMETMAALKTGKLTPLSVQEVIDCAGLGNSGCAGGDICLLLDWLVMTNAAVQSDKEYPLKLMNGACSLKKNATGVRVSTFTCENLVKDEEKILETLANHGPVAVAVNALTWQNYLGGVIQYHCSGSPLDLNHAVELVGYDMTGEVPFYIAKNSWGEDFGLDGYVLLAVGMNMCGLANEVAAVDVKIMRSKGVVGPVRNQGLCGACWAFSTVGAMETMAALKTGKLTPLSVQEVIDCAGLGNSGCAGGDICLLLDWLVMTNAAVQSDKEYPLKLMNGACSLKKNATGVRVSTFTCENLVKDEEKILETLANHGPVAVAVNALTWQNYLGGVIQYHCSGSPLDLNHAVELVGYDMTGEVPFYIAKNSWGEDFGLDGYVLLAVGMNMCGLANEVAAVDVKIM